MSSASPRSFFCLIFSVYIATTLGEVQTLLSERPATRWLGERLPGGPAGFIVPLDARHGVVRSRGLLRSGTLPVLGSVREVG